MSWFWNITLEMSELLMKRGERCPMVRFANVLYGRAVSQVMGMAAAVE
jgi:hypothetical protein